MAGLNCDIIFAYSSRRDYIGLMNFRNIVTMQVQHVFDATLSSGSSPTGMMPMYTGAYTGVIVNGFNFGTGRITSFSNPVSTDIKENGRHLWKQVVNIECYQSGDLSNISAGDTSVADMLTAYSTNLQALSESFAFSTTPEGDYTVSHVVQAKCNDDPISGVSGYIYAQRIASGIIDANANPPFGYLPIDSLNNHNYLAENGKRTYTETTDIYNGSCIIEEAFSIQSRYFVKHNINWDGGYASVSESVTMRNYTFMRAGDFSVNNNDTRVVTATGLSYTRCNNLYRTYAGILGTDVASFNLIQVPVQFNKAFDERSQEMTYTINYTSNPMMTVSGYMIDREQAFSKNIYGITEAVESANLTAYSFKDPTLSGTISNWVINEKAGAQNRLAGIWSAVSAFKESNEQMGVSMRGKRANYTITYTNDPTLIQDGTYLTLTSGVQLNSPIRIHNPFFVVGLTNPLVHDPGQTAMGSVSSTIQAVLQRPINYDPSNSAVIKPSTALGAMFLNAVTNAVLATNIIAPLDIFFTKVTYSYTNNYTAEISVEAQFTQSVDSRFP